MVYIQRLNTVSVAMLGLAGDQGLRQPLLCFARALASGVKQTRSLDDPHRLFQLALQKPGLWSL
jgi:hypothetical protein